jgi:hypothetical protein
MTGLGWATVLTVWCLSGALLGLVVCHVLRWAQGVHPPTETVPGAPAPLPAVALPAPRRAERDGHNGAPSRVDQVGAPPTCIPS